MGKTEAREVLGITAMDEVLKSGLENYKESLIKLLEVTNKNDKEERARIRLNIKAINILLREKAYDAE